MRIANCVWDYVARPFSLSAGNEGGPKGDALVNKLDFGAATTQTDRRGEARQDEARQVEASRGDLSWVIMLKQCSNDK